MNFLKRYIQKYIDKEMLGIELKFAKPMSDATASADFYHRFLKDFAVYQLIFVNKKDFMTVIAVQVVAEGSMKAYEGSVNVMNKMGTNPSDWTLMSNQAIYMKGEGQYTLSQIDIGSAPTISAVTSKVLDDIAMNDKVLGKKLVDKAVEVVQTVPIVSIDKYINELSYARDRYAETPSEKDALDRIINNIKNKHGRK